VFLLEVHKVIIVVQRFALSAVHCSDFRLIELSLSSAVTVVDIFTKRVVIIY